ncbi:hypothetical protein Bca101_006097 [Brassica carinata]
MEAALKLWFLVPKRKRSRKRSEAAGSVMESRFQKFRFWKRNGTCDSPFGSVEI